jgi:hypothetical protein
VRSLKAVFCAGLAFCLLAGAALADTVKLTAPMAPVTPEVKTGKGSATMSLDTASKTVSWAIDYSGVKAPEMGAFMIPGAKPSDDPTPLMLTIPANAASPIKGSTPLSDPQVAGIQSGAWWIMIGSKEGPEIGGQIKKAQ